MYKLNFHSNINFLYVLSNLPIIQMTLITNPDEELHQHFCCCTVSNKGFCGETLLQKYSEFSYGASDWRHYIDLKRETFRILDEKQLHATINEGLVFTRSQSSANVVNLRY
ncbi:hypothetical protein CEXT_224401 [Caerostris extrusa]|uniref:Uncharacterized protein n=1 Tax=Caerostris extrusa TaxID=172846 RepID=A0AAV4VBD9_CAEEX|nr:hypothetical protein CEXT_224401 [Caerostris extrusa]